MQGSSVTIHPLGKPYDHNDDLSQMFGTSDLQFNLYVRISRISYSSKVLISVNLAQRNIATNRLDFLEALRAPVLATHTISLTSINQASASLIPILLTKTVSERFLPVTVNMSDGFLNGDQLLVNCLNDRAGSGLSDLLYPAGDARRPVAVPMPTSITQSGFIVTRSALPAWVASWARVDSSMTGRLFCRWADYSFTSLTRCTFDNKGALTSKPEVYGIAKSMTEYMRELVAEIGFSAAMREYNERLT